MTITKNSPVNRSRYSLPQNFSDEEMARDWTLSESDKREIAKYRKISRLIIAVQLCSLRLYGRFLSEPNDLSLRIVNYLNGQLELPPSLVIQVPNREATYIKHRRNILRYLRFRKYDEQVELKLNTWLEQQAHQGELPDELLQKSERRLLADRIVLPGRSVLERLVNSVCSKAHERIFEFLSQGLSPEIKQAIDHLLSAPEGQQRSYFYKLKEYPPSAKISSIKNYLMRYRILVDTGINDFEGQYIDSSYLDYLFKVAKRYSAKDLKRFKEHKRYALMFCFLIETQKVLLDYLVKMHDQYLMDMCRQSKNVYEKMHRTFRKRQKKAVDKILDSTHTFLDWPEEQPIYKKDFFQKVDEVKLRESIKDLHTFKQLTERGYGDLLINRYPSLRKYFAEFIHLPFCVEQGNDDLLNAINLIRQLDAGEMKRLPQNLPIAFIPKELRRALKDRGGKINRSAWELGLALAIKDALRSGDLFLPKSKRHISFWDLILNESSWQKTREASNTELEQPKQHEAKEYLSLQFHKSASQAEKFFDLGSFAKIQNGKLRLKRDDKAIIPASVTRLQKAIDASMPSIRIEQLLMEVDKLTDFSRHFIPVQNHKSRPKNFYKTLMAAIISQATNLGVVSMCASVKGVSVDMLRHVLQYYIR
jgi:hypothetical protein